MTMNHAARRPEVVLGMFRISCPSRPALLRVVVMQMSVFLSNAATNVNFSYVLSNVDVVYIIIDAYIISRKRYVSTCKNNGHEYICTLPVV